MDRNGIVEKLTGIFHEVFNDQNIVLSNEMTAADVQNWDSLTHMMMITKVEEAFGIKFRLKELNKLKNVGNLCDIVAEKLGQ